MSDKKPYARFDSGHRCRLKAFNYRLPEYSRCTHPTVMYVSYGPGEGWNMQIVQCMHHTYQTSHRWFSCFFIRKRLSEYLSFGERLQMMFTLNGLYIRISSDLPCAQNTCRYMNIPFFSLLQLYLNPIHNRLFLACFRYFAEFHSASEFLLRLLKMSLLYG